MTILKCKMCGGDIIVNAEQTYGTCDSCGSTMTLPRVDSDQRANMFNRANHFRRLNDFDKAVAAYESILNADDSDAEAHWGVVLSRYGIEYVEDPATHERIPTCHRVQYESILADADYQAALVNAADTYTRDLYENEAARIAEIQKNILAISSSEKPYDVFICYKETSEAGTRTKDSTIAQDIYYQLTQEGYKVFFSRISLEDKLGTAYEPYIFAALNSAKVMAVVGTSTANFNAVWVKNEWSRFLALMKKDRSRLLIPCYRDIDPYDLPEELSMLQSQDMGKIGFIQDLVRGIKKVVDAGKAKPAPAQAAAPEASAAPGVQSLLKRANIFLEDGDFDHADEYFERVLDVDPECAEAYWGKLLASTRARNDVELAQAYINIFDSALDATPQVIAQTRVVASEAHKEQIDELRSHPSALPSDGLTLYAAAYADVQYQDFLATAKNAQSQFAAHTPEQNPFYQKAMRFARESEKARYSAVPEAIDVHVRSAMEKAQADTEKNIAQAAMDDSGLIDGKIQKIRESFAHRAEEARKVKQKKKIRLAVVIIVLAVVLIIICIDQIGKLVAYNKAKQLLVDGDYPAAVAILNKHPNYKDLKQLIEPFHNRVSGAVSAGDSHALGLKTDGTVIAVGDSANGRTSTESWTDIIEVSAGYLHTVGLRSDGTVVAIGDNTFGQIDVSDWKDIMAVGAGGCYTVGLKSDGTVVVAGKINAGYKDSPVDISNWRDIVSISAGFMHVVGVKSDGTVIAAGVTNYGWDYGQFDVSSWHDIVAVNAGFRNTIGLKSDGTVVAIGWNEYGQTDVSGWTGIVSISSGDTHILGLKADGTVVAAGWNGYGQSNVSLWRDIVQISGGGFFSLGLKSDGTVVAAGVNASSPGDCYHGQTNVSSWRLIID